MHNIYGEGIEKMSENPNLNPLFRSIFKDAYLPYRDPETLKLFLKTIDGFSYEHSEKLGDAYEYLPRTSANFPAGLDFVSSVFEPAGVRLVKATPLSFGIAWLYLGEVVAE